MSSTSKKGDKGKISSSAPASSREGSTNLAAKAVTKMVEVKSAEPGKALDQLNPKLQVSNFTAISTKEILIPRSVSNFSSHLLNNYGLLK